MRELTYTEQKEYDRMILGAKQLELNDFLISCRPKENTEAMQAADRLLNMRFVQMCLFPADDQQP